MSFEQYWQLRFPVVAEDRWVNNGAGFESGRPMASIDGRIYCWQKGSEVMVAMRQMVTEEEVWVMGESLRSRQEWRNEWVRNMTATYKGGWLVGMSGTLAHNVDEKGGQEVVFARAIGKEGKERFVVTERRVLAQVVSEVEMGEDGVVEIELVDLTMKIRRDASGYTFEVTDQEGLMDSWRVLMDIGSLARAMNLMRNSPYQNWNWPGLESEARKFMVMTLQR